MLTYQDNETTLQDNEIIPTPMYDAYGKLCVSIIDLAKLIETHEISLPEEDVIKLKDYFNSL